MRIHPSSKGMTGLTRGRRPVSLKLELEGFAVLFHSIWNTGNLASCNNNHSSTKLKNKDDVRFETQAMKKLHPALIQVLVKVLFNLVEKLFLV